MGERLRRIVRVLRRRRRARSVVSRPVVAAADAPRVAVVGPAWLTWLLAPDARIVGRGDPADLVVVGPDIAADAVTAEVAAGGWIGVPQVGYRSSVVAGPDEPLVQPALSNPVRRQAHADLPADLSERARAAIGVGVHAPAPGEPLASWMRTERAATDARRQALDRSVATVLLGATVPSDAVTVICVTNRPHLLARVIDNVARQTLRAGLVLVTNSEGFDDAAVESALEALPGARHMHLPATATLGECLNAALDTCTTRFVAKMDDDDHYDDTYLADQVAALHWSGAGVVGKHSCLAYLAGSDTTIVRFPGREHQFVGFVGGGTIVADLDQIGGVRFPHRDTGEDSGFLAGCEAAGALILSTGCLGYVQYRGGDNTWTVSDERFAEGAIALGQGSPDGCFDTPTPI